MRIPKALAILALCAALSPSQARPQQPSCLAPDFVIALVQSETPGAVVLAEHDGSEAATFLDVMNTIVSDEMPRADEITVLAYPDTTTVMLIGSTEGCLRWRGEFPLAQYEEAVWKAFGLPV